MSYFLVIRDLDKKTKEIIEFATFDEASAEEEKRDKAGHEGELVIVSASSLNEAKGGFSEYDNF